MKPPSKLPVVEKPPTPGQIAKANARRVSMGLAPLTSDGKITKPKTSRAQLERAVAEVKGRPPKERKNRRQPRGEE